MTTQQASRVGIQDQNIAVEDNVANFRNSLVSKGFERQKQSFRTIAAFLALQIRLRRP